MPPETTIEKMLHKDEAMYSALKTGAQFTKKLRRNLKLIISFFKVYLKFILSYKFKIFIDSYM